MRSRRPPLQEKLVADIPEDPLLPPHKNFKARVMQHYVSLGPRKPWNGSTRTTPSTPSKSLPWIRSSSWMRLESNPPPPRPGAYLVEDSF